MTVGTRREEFLDAALDLFHTKSYDLTTVNDIIDRLDASKGAFYHYFKSKEDVLEAVIQRQIEAELEITQKTAVDDRLNAAEKLNCLISNVLVHKALTREERQKISQVFEHDGNVKFQRKLVDNKHSQILPWYINVVEQGIREGYFATGFPVEAAEQVVHLMSILNSAVTRLSAGIAGKPDNTEAVGTKISAYQEAIERILGARPGTINLTAVRDAFTRLPQV